MVNQELIDYVKSELDRGVSKENIKSSLLANGWQINDIEAVFNNTGGTTSDLNAQTKTTTTTTSPNQQDSNSNQQPAKKSSKLWIIIVIIIILALAIGAYFYYKSISKSSTNIITPTQTPATTADTLNYVSQEFGYSFNYPSTWTIQTQGSATSVYSPERKNEVFGDFLISTYDYATIPGAKSHFDQIKDTAIEIDKNAIPISLAGKQGFLATTAGPDNSGMSSSLNYFLEGNNNVILIQFFNTSSANALSAGQKIIYDSIKILK